MGPFDLYGFNVTGWDPNALSDHSLVDKGLNYAQTEGANYIAIDWAVNFNPDGSIAETQVSAPSLSDIAYVISGAQQRGLKVYLKPHTSDATSPSNLNVWNIDKSKFSVSTYLSDLKSYLTDLADFATSHNVDGICIGTEANMADTQDRAGWSDMISSVRQKFAGQITYDAILSLFKDNPDVGDVCFWDLCDYISVSAYVPLSNDDNASASVLNAAWTNNTSSNISNVVSYFEEIAKKYNKEIFFGESGFQSVSGALWDTNSSPSDSKIVNNDVQVKGIQSLLDTWAHYKSDWFKGLSLWQITPNLLSDAMLSNMWHTQEFATYGKPAAQTIKDWFTGVSTYTDTNYTGTSASEKLIASFGNDSVDGGKGNDTLTGGVGNDTISGGDGTDTAVYIGNSSNYSIAKNASGYTVTDNVGTDGTDTVSKIENLKFSDKTVSLPADGTAKADKIAGSSGDDALYGYAGNDTLSGDTGNDTLVGGDGKDKLTGGVGNDIFKFDSVLNPKSNLDTITDFVSNTDSIQLDKSIFTAYTAAGTDLTADFVSGVKVKALDSTDHFLYDTKSGALYYDADGIGTGKAVQFASITGHPTLSASDLHIF